MPGTLIFTIVLALVLVAVTTAVIYQFNKGAGDVPPRPPRPRPKAPPVDPE